MLAVITIRTDLHSLAPEKDSICFIAYADGATVRCYITRDALRRHFPSKTGDMRDSFLENRSRIAEVAEDLLDANYLEGATEFLIREQDISPA
jgi:hypothetical protein